MSLELKNVEKKVGIETHIYSTNLKLEKNTKFCKRNKQDNSIYML